jgi:hypothetical protein
LRTDFTPERTPRLFPCHGRRTAASPRLRWSIQIE